jgi:hypothetical protein
MTRGEQKNRGHENQKKREGNKQFELSYGLAGLETQFAYIELIWAGPGKEN